MVFLKSTKDHTLKVNLNYNQDTQKVKLEIKSKEGNINAREMEYMD